MTDSSLVGQTLAGYRILEAIGEGGMGTVYKAEHATIGKQVAIKVLQKHFAHMPDVLSRFIQEAKAVNDIRHENVIDILGFDHTEEKEPFILMEYLEGQTLSAAVEAEAPFATGRAVHIALQISSALFAAHEQGIIHRDLKGDNVFLVKKRAKKDFVKLIDFGIAKLLNNGLGGSTHTRTGAFVGTPICTAPEQADGGVVDARTDVYAFGVLLHQMATGFPPFYDKNPHLLIALHLTAALPPPKERFADISPALETIIVKCLEKKKEDRFTSMKEVAAALAKISHKNLIDYYFPEETRQIKIEPSKQEPATAVDIVVSPQTTQITPLPEGLSFPQDTGPIAKITTDSIPAGESFLPTPKKAGKHTWKIAGLAAALLLILLVGFGLPESPSNNTQITKKTAATQRIAAPETKPTTLTTPQSTPALPVIDKSTKNANDKTNKNKNTNDKTNKNPKNPATTPPTEEPKFTPKIPFTPK